MTDGSYGVLTQPSDQTVESYLRQWFEGHRLFGGRDGGPLAPNTVRDYETQLRLHILPAIGALRLTKVTPGHLRALYAQILDKGLSPRRAEQAHRLLHCAFEAAVKEGLLTRNPMVSFSPRQTEAYGSLGGWIESLPATVISWDWIET